MILRCGERPADRIAPRCGAARRPPGNRHSLLERKIGSTLCHREQVGDDAGGVLASVSGLALDVSSPTPSTHAGAPPSGRLANLLNVPGKGHVQTTGCMGCNGFPTVQGGLVIVRLRTARPRKDRTRWRPRGGKDRCNRAKADRVVPRARALPSCPRTRSSGPRRWGAQGPALVLTPPRMLRVFFLSEDFQLCSHLLAFGLRA
jgi:hypothetical protein